MTVDATLAPSGPLRPLPSGTGRPIRKRHSTASSTASRRSARTRSTGFACADSTPIAFGATIARFLPADQLAALEAMETAVEARLDPHAAARPGVRDAVEGYATELVLGSFLDDMLSEPFRERARERLTRGWEAAVGQPRYGPNGVAVRGLIGRLAELDADGIIGPGGHVRNEPAWTAVRPSRGRPGPRPRTTRPCACRRCWPRRMRQPRSTPTGPQARS